jgi:hypothetical protein
MCINEMHVLCTGVVGSKLAQPLIQRKNGQTTNLNGTEYKFGQPFEPAEM